MRHKSAMSVSQQQQQQQQQMLTEQQYLIEFSIQVCVA
jgi:hypothetical protein